MNMFGAVGETVSIQGSRVRYFRLGCRGARPLMLVHGGGAHAGWWAGVVPSLGLRYDILVPDLSGHGNSEHRARYSGALWAAELAELAKHVGWDTFDLVGHSMGGKIGAFVASRLPDVIGRLVMVDSAFRRPGQPPVDPNDRPRPQHKIYATFDDAVARFRLRPGDTSAEPALLRLVAENAVRAVPGGWTWKFDPASRQQISNDELHQELLNVRCPVRMIHGARSGLVGPDTLDYLRERLAGDLGIVAIAQAYHHVPLDQPERCAAAIHAVLS